MYRDFAEALKIAEDQKYLTNDEAKQMFKDFVETHKKDK